MNHLNFSVEGMTCSSCSGSVERALKGLQGIDAASVAVSVTTNTGKCIYDPTVLKATQIIEAIESIGFDGSVLSDKPQQSAPKSVVIAAPSTKHKLTIGLDGMTCTTCSGTVERVVAALKGVEAASVSVSLTTNTAKLVFDTATITAAAIAESIEDVGFGATVLDSKPLTTSRGGEVAEGMEVRKDLIITCASRNKGGGEANEEDEEVDESLTTFVRTLITARARRQLARFQSNIRRWGLTSPASRAAAAAAAASKLKQASGVTAGAVDGAAGVQKGPNRFTRANVARIAAALPTIPGVLEVNTKNAFGAIGSASVGDEDFDEDDEDGGDAGAGGHIVVTVNESVMGPRRLVAMFKDGSAAGAGPDAGLEVTVSSLGGFLMAGRMLQQHNAEMVVHLFRFIIGFVFTMPILIITMIQPMIDPVGASHLKETMIVPGLNIFSLLLVILTTPVQYGVGWAFHVKAYKTVRSGSLGMDFLISSGTNAAYIYSFVGVIRGLVNGVPRDMDVEFFETAAVLIAVVLFGKVLELYAKGRTALAIHKLNSLKAKTARLVRGADEREGEGGAVANGGASGAVSGATSRRGSVDGDAEEGGPDSPWREVSDEEEGLFAADEGRIASRARRRGSNGANGARSRSNSALATGSTGDRIIDASLLQAGDVIRLVEGESVPADGEFISPHPITIGVDESMMTGESKAVYKSAASGIGGTGAAGKSSNSSTVFGGTMVIEGSGLVKVTACGDDSALGRIVSTVQEAQSSKPPIQEIADAIAARFVPAVAIISLVTFLVWFIAAEAFHVVPMMWIQMKAEGNVGLFCFLFALAVWVSACPCAFGLATPTAILVSTGLAAKNGILIRRGAALQYAAEVTTVAFDKTGTLTYGRTEVTNCKFLPSIPTAEEPREPNPSEKLLLLYLLKAAEEQSSHPISKGIVKHCTEALGGSSKGEGVRHESLLDASFGAMSHLFAAAVASAGAEASKGKPVDVSGLLEIVTVTGSGIKMIVRDEATIAAAAAAAAGAGAGAGDAKEGADVTVDKANIVLVGNSRLLRENGVDIPEAVLTQSIAYRRQGKITVYYTCGGVVRGIIALSDIIRPESAAVISVLQRRYNIACYMITGDDEVTALAVAGQLGLPADRVFASQKPEDKQSVIKKLQHLNRDGSKSANDTIAKNCVAFVGDGTNDSPALAQADVGFAMAGGTDIAVETGDMVLCKAELTALVVAIDLSKVTLRRIILNYVWAFIYNILLVPLAAGVLYPTYQIALDPMLAGAAMALSSVSIVLSSLALSFYKPPKVAVTPPKVDGVLVTATEMVKVAATPSVGTKSKGMGKGKGSCCGADVAAAVVESSAPAADVDEKPEQRLCGCVRPSSSFVYSNIDRQAAYARHGGYVSAVLGGEADEGDYEEEEAGEGDALKMSGITFEGGADGGDLELPTSKLAAALGCRCGCENCRCGASCRCHMTDVAIMAQ